MTLYLEPWVEQGMDSMNGCTEVRQHPRSFASVDRNLQDPMEMQV
jgi:hypothetical protein